MNRRDFLKTTAAAGAALAAALFPFRAFMFAQSVSKPAGHLLPYSATSPDNCCTYQPPPAPGQNPNGIHIFIFAGLKSHEPGQHDYPQFLADWSKFLTARGAVVDGALHAPSTEELARTDVVVIFKGDAGFMTPKEHAALLAYVKRGGGLVCIHDSLCGPDPKDMAMFVGGGKKHGQVNYTLGAPVNYDVVDPSSAIMDGFPNRFTIDDEAFYHMTWATDPKIHVLATAKIPDTPSAVRGGGVGKVVPQIWTYEHTLPGGHQARAFVWMQGHIYENFSKPVVQNMLLRGIAWAARHPAGELVDYKPHINPRAAFIPMRQQQAIDWQSCRFVTPQRSRKSSLKTLSRRSAMPARAWGSPPEVNIATPEFRTVVHQLRACGLLGNYSDAYPLPFPSRLRAKVEKSSLWFHEGGNRAGSDSSLRE